MGTFCRRLIKLALLPVWRKASKRLLFCFNRTTDWCLITLFSIIKGNWEWTCRVCVHSWLVKDKIRSIEELQLDGGRWGVCRAALCNCRATRKSLARRNKQKVLFLLSSLKDLCLKKYCVFLRILDLQKDRFFETLNSKYWNQSLKGSCPNADDNEGITLESLGKKKNLNYSLIKKNRKESFWWIIHCKTTTGGVFIATLFGLGMAMVILAFEVFYYKKRNLKEGGQKKPQQIMVMPKQPPSEATFSDKEIFEKLTSRLQMRPAPVGSLMGKNIGRSPDNQMKVSTISVYPRKVPLNTLPFKD